MLTAVGLLIAGLMSERVLQAQQQLNTRTAAENIPGTAIGQSDEAAVRELQTQMIDAYNRGDTEAVSAMFAPDGDMITGAADHLKDPAEIGKYLSGLLVKLPKGTRFIASVANVRFAGPDVAVLTSNGGWLHPGETTVAEKNHGIQSLVAVRQNGTWRAILFQRTRKTPPKSSK
jgi:uncharacterized protein (TIGR02246 family)